MVRSENFPAVLGIGERRQLACWARLPAEHMIACKHRTSLSQLLKVVGKLPTTAGWQPALPRTENRIRSFALLSFRRFIRNQDLLANLQFPRIVYVIEGEQVVV